MLQAAFLITYWFRFHSGIWLVPLGIPPLDMYLAAGLVVLLVFFGIFYASGMYTARGGRAIEDDLVGLFKGVVLGSLLVLALVFGIKPGSIPVDVILIIMSVIPFGAIGAVIGHIIMGHPISMFSMFGLIALAGVVVNDSLIMIDFINKAREAGTPIRRAVIESGTLRFRAIFLTSLTTAAGLAPILFETSMMAGFVVPAAVSLAFGIVFATIITLFLIPSLYMLQDDWFAWISRLRGRDAGRSRATESEIA